MQCDSTTSGPPHAQSAASITARIRPSAFTRQPLEVSQRDDCRQRLPVSHHNRSLVGVGRTVDHVREPGSNCFGIHLAQETSSPVPIQWTLRMNVLSDLFCAIEGESHRGDPYPS